MTTVYRVQNERGCGAYYGGLGVDATNMLDAKEWDLARRVGPANDFQRAQSQYNAMCVDFWTWLHAFQFAFPSVEAAYRWFPLRAMQFLESRGFFLHAVDADLVLLSDSGEQVIYRALPPAYEEGDVRGIA